MKRVFMAMLIALSIFIPAAVSFADLSTDSGLSTEISSDESEAQEEIEEVDSEMGLPGGGA
jgi:hypothetical protein